MSNSLQNELSLMKLQLNRQEKEYQRRIQTLEQRNLDLTLQLEETRRSAENRVDSLYREMKSSTLSHSEPIIKYEILKSTESWRAISRQQDSSQYNQNGQRQIENLNLVLQTKDQEIKAYEERLLMMKQQHDQQVQQLKEHYESIWKHKLNIEMQGLQIQYQKEIQEYQVEGFSQKYNFHQYEDRVQRQLNEKQVTIDILNEKIKELESNQYQLVISKLERELQKLREELKQSRQDYQVEIQLLNEKNEMKLQQEYQKGFEAAIDDKYSNMELMKLQQTNQNDDKLQYFESENKQLNTLLQNYQSEIEQWREKYNATLMRQREEIEKLRQSFESQKKSQFEMINVQDQEQDKIQLNLRLEQSNKQIQILTQNSQRLEQELREYRNDLVLQDNLQKELEVSRRENKQLSSELEKLKIRIQQFDLKGGEEKQRIQDQFQQYRREVEQKLMLYQQQIQDREGEIEEYRIFKLEMNQTSERFNMQMESIKRDYSLQLKQAQETIKQLTQEIEQYQEKIHLLSMERYNFETQLNKLKGSSDQVSNLQKNMLQQNQIIENLNQEIDELNQQIEQYQKQIKSQKNQEQQLLNSLRQELKELQINNDQLQLNIKEREQQYDQICEDIQSFEFECQQFNQQRQDYEQKIKQLLGEIDDKDEQVLQFQNQIFKQRQEYESKIQQILQENKKQSKQIQDYDADNQILQERIFKLESDNNRLNNRVNSLDQANQQLEQQYVQRSKQMQDRLTEFDEIKDKLEKSEPLRQSIITQSTLFEQKSQYQH